MKMDKRHMHPSIILENVISWIGAGIVLVFAFAFQEIEEAENIWLFIEDFITFKNIILVILGIIGVLLIIAFISFLIWRKTYIYIDDNFNYESGRVFKTHIKINLEDIATIIVRKNLIERLLHTSKIKLELNAGGDDTIRRKMVFKDEDVKYIKNLVFNKEEKEETITSLVNYSTNDITKHLLLSTNILSLIILICVTVPAFIYTMYDTNFKNIIMLILILIIVGVPIVWSIIKRYFDYHNFKLWEEDEKIKVSYGLFVNYHYEIPKNKINAVVISQTLQAKIFNKYVIKVINAGVGNEEDEQTIICLYSDKKTINKLMKVLFPEFIDNSKTIKQDKKALITYLINKVPFIFVMAIICMWFSKWLLLVDLLFVVWAFVQYKTKNIKISEKLLTVTNGFFEKNKIILKTKKITKIDFVDTLIGKLYNIKYLKINTVGASQSMQIYSGYYNHKIENKVIKNFK